MPQNFNEVNLIFPFFQMKFSCTITSAITFIVTMLVWLLQHLHVILLVYLLANIFIDPAKPGKGLSLSEA